MSDALNWHTSSYTGTENCVEVAENAPDLRIRIRDSKRPDAAVMDVSAESWAAFLGYAVVRMDS
ncbi:DUF397 domain-containing protein [Streptomyces sp. NPDC050095]|uniref:DUF397 domain-containing protein n=1 Tax=unclassified Streptomyces TaxID=2593676 RepID=UPI0034259180